MRTHDEAVLNWRSSQQQEIDHRPDIVAPLIVKTKGRPRQKRLTSAVERANRSLKRARLDLNTEPDAGGGTNDGAPTTSSEAVTGPCKTASIRQQRHCHACGAAGHYATTCSRRKGKD
jgi:hypothetical protein